MLQSIVPERSELQAAQTKDEASGHQSWLTGKSIGVTVSLTGTIQKEAMEMEMLSVTQQ